jgi:threonine aldolase
LAYGLSQIDGLKVPIPMTNIIYFEVANDNGAKLCEILKTKYGILFGKYTSKKIRCTTHLDITNDDIDYAIDAVSNIMNDLAK